MAKDKTNVCRLLDSAGIGYEVREYPVDEGDLSALHAVEMAGLPVEQVFKTLVLRGASGKCFVCCVSAADELDLKKAARAAGEKKCDLIPQKELLPLTGYVRGGCSPIGMKKKFAAFIDETAQLFDAVAVSAGMRGMLALIGPQDLAAYVSAEFADLSVR
jgi:Cys-tRNA(Pro)/Cys-tRNA(Cys) deacylase